MGDDKGSSQAARHARLSQLEQPSEAAAGDWDPSLARNIVGRLQRMDEIRRGDWRGAIRRTTESVAKTINFERVSVFRTVFAKGHIIGYQLVDLFRQHISIDDDGEHCDDAWLVPPDSPGARQGFIPAAMCPRYHRSLCTESVTYVAKDGGDELSAELDPYLSAHKISMMSDSSILWHGQFLGLLCCEHVGQPGDRSWTEGEKDFIGQAAIILSQVLLQAQADATDCSGSFLTPINFKARSVFEQTRMSPAREYLERSNGGGSTGGYLSEKYGFLPPKPVKRLPPSHQALEDFATKLPEMYSALNFVQQAEALPHLSCAQDDLADEYLPRANVLLGLCVHAIWHFGVAGGNEMPPVQIMQPWDEVCRRVGKLPPCSGDTAFDADKSRGSYLGWVDLFLHNWTFRDDSAAGANGRKPNSQTPSNITEVLEPHLALDVSIPVFNSRSEHSFIIGTVAMEIEAIPLVGSILRCQDAMLVGDDTTLMKELWFMQAIVEQVTDAFQAISPCPFSPTYCDPVEWGKTIAQLANPLPNEQAPSGRLSPLANLLDAFIGRENYDFWERKQKPEIDHIICGLHRGFFQTVRTLPVREYVRVSGNPALFGAYQQLVDAWAGEAGFLHVHRLKGYNYVELALKCGRTGTTGSGEQPTGIGDGKESSRPWYWLAKELNRSREERVAVLAGLCPYRGSTVLKDKTRSGQYGGTPARQLTLDLTGTGLRYKAGDTVRVWSRNSKALVQRTIAALGSWAESDTTVRANTSQWQQALLQHGKVDDFMKPPEHIKLGDLLYLASLRPLSTKVATELVSAAGSIATDNIVVRDIIHRASHKFELWDFLRLLGSLGVDIKALMKGGDILCELVQPLPPRQYSITSACLGEVPSDVEITVGTCEYHEDNLALWREVLSAVTQSVKPTEDPVPQSPHGAKLERCLTSHHAQALEKEHHDQDSVADSYAENEIDTKEVGLLVRLKDLASQRPTLTSHLSERAAAAFQIYDAIGKTVESWTGQATTAAPHEIVLSEQPETQVIRAGTCSSFLASKDASSVAFPVDVEPHRKFHLPEDPTGPVVLVGIGTGVSPMISFLRTRAAINNAGPTVLYWGVSTKELAYNSYLGDLLKASKPGKTAGKIAVRISCSREDVQLLVADGKVVEEPTPKRRINILLQSPEYAKELATLVGHPRAAIYICGVSDLARTTHDAVRSALAEHKYGGCMIGAEKHILDIAARGGWCLDVFNSGSAPSKDTKLYSLTAVARPALAPKFEQRGCLTIFQRNVYDIKTYMSLHPGGHKLLSDKLGRDCTEDFNASHLEHNTAIHAQFEIYRAGTLAEPNCGSAEEKQLWEAWRKFLWLSVEVHNMTLGTINRQDMEPEGPARDDRPRVSTRHQDGGAHAVFVETSLSSIICAAKEVWGETLRYASFRSALQELGAGAASWTSQIRSPQTADGQFESTFAPFSAITESQVFRRAVAPAAIRPQNAETWEEFALRMAELDVAFARDIALAACDVVDKLEENQENMLSAEATSSVATIMVKNLYARTVAFLKAMV